MAESSGTGTRNRILAALPAEDYARIARHLERVDLETRQILFDVNRPIDDVYFPEATVISVLGVMSDGSAVETATVGPEGMVGLPVFLDTDQTTAQAFAQIPGPAQRMRADRFREVLAESPALVRALNRYTQALFTLVAQSSACNRMHAMTQRCARWLLHTHDRVGADEFPLTQQFLSQMLGVRRATVTEAMGGLQELGAIEYEMGHIRVRSRPTLEAEACECYAIIAGEFSRLLDPTSPGAAAVKSPLDGLKASERGRSTARDGAPAGPTGGD